MTDDVFNFIHDVFFRTQPSFISLAAAADGATEALRELKRALDRMIETALLDLDMEQRFLYEQLIAAGTPRFDALAEAQKL